MAFIIPNNHRNLLSLHISPIRQRFPDSSKSCENRFYTGDVNSPYLILDSGLVVLLPVGHH